MASQDFLHQQLSLIQLQALGEDTEPKRQNKFSQQQNQSLNVFKELVTNQAKSNSDNFKRSIELYLDSAIAKCSLKDFYRVKEVYQRNQYCSITGVYLEVKDIDLASNFTLSRRLVPSFESPTRINEEFGAEDEHDDDIESIQCASLLRFSSFTAPSENIIFYQRSLPRDQIVSHCSVSDAYIVYTVTQRQEKAASVAEAEELNARMARQTLVVIIDVKNKKELVLRNPSAGLITAVYVDESILMLGSSTKLFHLTPARLFASEMGSFDPTAGSFEELSLPGDYRKDYEIYAFWHTKKQVKFDIFVRSTKQAELVVFNFFTTEGLEKLKQQEQRRSVRLQKQFTRLQDLKEIEHVTTINLALDHLRNHAMSRKKNAHSIVLNSLNQMQGEIGEDVDSFKSDESFDEEEKEDESLTESSDDEGYDSDQKCEDELIDTVGDFQDHKIGIADLEPSSSSAQRAQMGTSNSYNSSELESPGLAKKLRRKPTSLEGQNLLKRKYTVAELHEPFLPQGYDHEDPGKSNDAAPSEFIANQKNVFITRVKFSRRSTIVFRSDGHVDFVGSNNVVYSSRNIDFKNLKWDPATNQQKLSARSRSSPLIKDVIFDEHDALILTADGTIYLFSTDRMTISKSTIKPEQAQLYPYHNRLCLFSDFIVYDNIVVVSHYNMISICDLNAKVCKEKSWRHVSQPLTDSAAASMNVEEVRKDPFKVCSLNIRMIKLREFKGSVAPCILVLFYNNAMRMMRMCSEMKWQYDQSATRTIDGHIVSVVCSKKQNSLMMLRHKEEESQARSNLIVFYIDDQDMQGKHSTVLEGLQDHQRVIQVTLQGRYMRDFDKQQTRPLIGVYDEKTWQMTLQKLQTVQELRNLGLINTGSVSESSLYGQFKPVYKIDNFKMLQTDIVVESGEESYVYLARQNKIFKVYLSEEAMRQAQRQKYSMSTIKEQSQVPDLSAEHPNMEEIAKIQSRYAKYSVVIEDFRVIVDNKTTYIYASTRSQIYFNQINMFGKLFSGSKLLPPALARTSYNLYLDNNYGQVASYDGPFDIIVMPFLSSNRISLRGAHHEADPIFHQTRGQTCLHMLTGDSKLKTWDTTTGKLVSCVQLEQNRYVGYQKMNFFRNRTILCRQNQETMRFEYLCVEIVSNRKVMEYARLVTDEHMNLFINSNDDLVIVEQRGAKHNVFDILRFDKNTGEIVDPHRPFRTFNRSIPMNFLSPSFHHYIDIESHTHRIKVMDTQLDQLVCLLPKHLFGFMCSKKDSFSTDTFVNKLIFAEEDFILMELDQSNEIIFHVESGRTVSSFNSINPNFKYNEKFYPCKFQLSLARQMKQSADAYLKAMVRSQTTWISNDGQKQLQFSDDAGFGRLERGSERGQRSHEQLGKLRMLEDFMYMNMKRQRHIHFLEQQAECTIVRDIEGSTSDDQYKLVSVNSFSYATWKLMEDLTTEKTLAIHEVNSDLLAAACFAVLPDSLGNRVRGLLTRMKDPDQRRKIHESLQTRESTPTLLHKLTIKNPDQIKPLVERMKNEWPNLVIPHIYNFEGVTPIKLAHKLRNRRVIGWLLDMLKSYPFGYCQYQLANMVFDLINEGFEAKVGEYLDSRFKTQKWTEKYTSGCLMLFDSGINQTTVNNWPSRKQNFENKFFKETCLSIPVKMKILDSPNLHAFSKVDTQKLLLALSSCDISIFSFKSIQALIEYNWESTKCVIIGWLFLPFMGYLVTYMIFLEILFRQDSQDADWERHMQIYTVITQALLLIFAIFFIQLHVRQVVMREFRIDSAMLWSSVDLVPLLANVASIVIALLHGNDQSTMIEVQRPIYAAATLFLFLKLFYFLRYFREIGHLVRMIFTVMHQMRFFFIVFFCFIFTFASSFYAFTGGQKDYLTQFMFVFNITIRKSDTSWFSEGYELLLWLAFLCTSMFFTYIMLNITVSMVKGFYDAQMRIKTESQYQVMTQLTLDCFPFIRAPRAERDLCPPEGTVDEFLEEPNYYEPEKSFFQFKMRKNSFCNQYLLVAETEKADAGSLYAANHEQVVRDLQVQVKQGFSGVQKQLQHQDEILQLPASQVARQGSGTGFAEAVEKAVDERVQELTAKHSHEIEELKESQREMLALLKAHLKKD